jgi:hypothetical protein
MNTIIKKQPLCVFRFYPENKCHHLIDLLEKNKVYFAHPRQFKESDLIDCKTFELTVETKDDVECAIREYIDVLHSDKSEIEKRLEYSKTLINIQEIN